MHRTEGKRDPERRRYVRPLVLRLAVASVLVAALSPPASAGHWYASGWRDQHYNYPPRPSGYWGIVNVFGPPCNSEARHHTTWWNAADDGRNYAVVFHRKLGAPYGTTFTWDVRGHIGNAHLDAWTWRGIWGYNCRFIDGTTRYSTHAFGIAVDTNSAYEHVGHYHNHTIPWYTGFLWESHNWYWGLRFGDAMHFQYATNY